MSWRTHEWIDTCATCATTTPHTRRRVGNWAIFGIVLFASALSIAIWNWTSAGAQIVVAMCALVPLLLAVGVVSAARGRDQDWNIACDRCRNRGARRADPRTTIIDVF